MFLKKTKVSKNRTYLQIVGSYRVNGVVKQRVIEKIGFLDELEKKYDDPIAYFTKKAKEMSTNKNDKENIEIDFNKELDKDKYNLLNVGYFPLKRIYEEIGLSDFCQNKQRQLDIEYSLNKNLLLLVLSRILYPGSKKAAYENKERFFEPFLKVTKDSVYNTLDYLDKYKDDIQKTIYQNSKDAYSRDTSVSYYDCTNYYFDIEYNDEDVLDEEGNIVKKGLRKRGPEKNKRPDPIVELGLMMDNDGIPLGYDIFPGNESEKLSLRPALNKMKKDYGIERTIVVADRGLNTSDNIFFINGFNKQKDDRDGYLYGQSIRGADKEFKDWAISEEGFVSETFNHNGQLIENGFLVNDDTYISFIHKSRIVDKTIKIKKDGKRNTTVKIKQKQMVYFSFKYMMKQRRDREKMIEKAKEIIKKPGAYTRTTSYGAAAYINNLTYNAEDGIIIEKELSLNEEKIKEEAKYDGYYSIVTSELDMPDYKMRNVYKGLAKIEDTFMVSKSLFSSRPVFVYKQEHIRAHFLTCYIALVVIRLLEKKLDNKYPLEKILDALKKYECIYLDKNIYQFLYNDEVIDELSTIYNVKLNTKYKRKEEIKKILKY